MRSFVSRKDIDIEATEHMARELPLRGRQPASAPVKTIGELLAPRVQLD